MQYSHTPTLEDVQTRLYPHWLRHLPVAAIAALAGYGLGTHHVLLVGAGLIALLAWQNRLQAVGPRGPGRRARFHCQPDRS